MASSCRIGAWLRPGLWVALALTPAVVMPADREKRKPMPKGELVDVFSGIETGQIEVQLIARDSARANLLVKNRTEQPLSVVLPQAFAGVPVAAQFQGPGFDPLNGQANDRRVPQNLGLVPNRNNWPPGGPMNLPGPNFRNRNFPGQNMPPGFWFNVAPEKVGKLKLAGVCLEYGKPDPRPKFKYQIEPIQSATDKPEVAELCAMLGRGEIGQRAAQLAAWHLNNEVSWQKLESRRTKLAVGTRPTYTRRELEAGKQAAQRATKLAKQRRKATEDDNESLSGEPPVDPGAGPTRR